LDHILIGNFNGIPEINQAEVSSWKWMTLEQIQKDIRINPDDYTAWFKIIIDKFHQNFSL